MSTLYKPNNITPEMLAAWEKWKEALQSYDEAMTRLQDTAKAVDNAFNEYVKLRG